MLSLALGGTLLLGAGPTTKTGSLSVGDFALLVANRLQAVGTHQAPMTPESAVLLLQKAGISVRPDLAAPATEGDAADVFRQIGIALEPQDAGSPLELERAQSLVSIFGSALAARAESTLSAGAAMKGIHTTPSRDVVPSALEQTIADCQALPKTQDCQLCCRNLLGSGSQNDTHSNRICGKACNSKTRNASASEPTP